MGAVIVNLDAWKRERQRPAQGAGDDVVEAWLSWMRAVIYWQWELWGLSTQAGGRSYLTHNSLK
jgi:hypothetical protein